MKYEIVGNPEYGQLNVDLDAGDVIVVEGGGMSWMSTGMEMKSRMLGGFFRSAFRKMMGGESLFVGEYHHPTGGRLVVTPSLPGSILHRRLNEESIFLTKGSFLGCTPDIKLKTKFGGFKSLFSGEGAFVIECSGTGDLFFNTFGAVIEKEINGAFTVDTSHVVAWDPGLTYSIGGMGNWKSTMLSGEGLVMKFSGTGRLYLQTRVIQSLAGWLTSYLRG